MTEHQPILPLETPLSDAELAFMDESPPALFPDNQNSNFGYIIRKVFSDFIQELINQQNVIYSEHFVPTSIQFLDEWEKQVGLPPNPTGLTTQQRRNLIVNKLRVGPFTRARRDAVVASFVSATIGEAVALTPQGVALTGAGVPLFSGLTSLVGAYTITEDIPNFSFTITVAQGVTLDQVALTRELNRVVPAGISFTVITANSQFKVGTEIGHDTEAQSMTTRPTFTVTETGVGTDTSIVAPKFIVVSETGVGNQSGTAFDNGAAVGYGSGAYGSGSYGGIEKVTGLARLSLSAIPAPATTEQVHLRVRARKTNALDAGVLIVWLYQGSTLIEGPYQITLQDAFTTDDHILLNANLISSWSTLEVRVQAAATNTGGSLTTQVSKIELQTQ